MNNTKKSILIVDDQNNWREALSDILNKEGYSIKAVSSFDDAKYELELNNFDLFILDVRLADADVFNTQGLELLQLIKTKDEKTKVMILTGYPESIRSGFLDAYKTDALVLKVPPRSRFNSKEFIMKIHNLLND